MMGLLVFKENLTYVDFEKIINLFENKLPKVSGGSGEYISADVYKSFHNLKHIEKVADIPADALSEISVAAAPQMANRLLYIV